MESLLRLTLSRKGFYMLQTVFTVLDHNEQIKKKSAVISCFEQHPKHLHPIPSILYSPLTLFLHST